LKVDIVLLIIDLDKVVENHKKEEDDAQEVGEHGQLDVAYHPVQNLVS